MKFLELLVHVLLQSDQAERAGLLFPMELADAIVSGAYELSKCETTTELSTASGDRIDILIKCALSVDDTELDTPKHLLILVENKVKSTEHGNQTQRYWDWANQVAASLFEDLDDEDKVAVVGVYLTPLSDEDFKSLKRCECSCDRYIQINYQGLMDHVLQPVLALDMGQRAQFILDEYIRNLSYPDTYDELDVNEIRKGGLVMAVPREERELLRSFYEKHKSLLLAVLEAYRPHAESGVQDKISEFQSQQTGGVRAPSDKPVRIDWTDDSPSMDVGT